MDSIPLVRAAAYWPVVEAMKRIGVPVQKHMAVARIQDEVMYRSELLLPEYPLWKLFDRARELEGIDDIGFIVGASHSVTDIPGLSTPLSGQVSLLALLKAFCIQLKGHANNWSFWLSGVSDGVLFCRRATPGINTGTWPLEQYAIGYMSDLVRMAAAPTWFPSRIWLMVNQDKVRNEANHLKASEVLHDQPFTAIHIPTELLPLPVHYESSPTDALRNREFDTEFFPSLRRLILSYSGISGFGLNELAELIGMNSRTLQRRLAEHGTSFRGLISETRFEMARDRLSNPDVSVSQIAFELGYLSLSGFNKEFRKWSGMSPGAFRMQLQVE